MRDPSMLWTAQPYFRFRSLWPFHRFAPFTLWRQTLDNVGRDALAD